MADLDIRIEGQAGRITLTRPQALNALSYDMCLAIDVALTVWQSDPRVALVLIDAEGPRAFCAGGDLTEMYATGRAGNYSYGRRFWADEYRMNARIGRYPKPVVAFLQGFVMGGGVGLGCHASHRIVGESSQVAMPECAVGLVPDVGGSALLARAPGQSGAYLGTTGTRMGPADAIFAGFADHFIPEAAWPDLKDAMVEGGVVDRVASAARAAPPGRLAGLQDAIGRHFATTSLAAVTQSLAAAPDDFALQTLAALRRASPLAAAATLEMLHRLGPTPGLETALRQEYRFTFRALERADFLEGIRAAIIDKDKTPRWKHGDPAAVPGDEVAAMLAPLGADELRLEEMAG